MTVYFMAGYRSPAYTPAFVGARPPRTLVGARGELYGSRDFLLWHSPQKIIRQVSNKLAGCPIETVAAAASPELERYGNVRHRIAHSSSDAETKFQAAAVLITGHEHRSVGRFLRSDDLSDPLNPKKRVLVIRDHLVDLLTTMQA